MKERFTVTLIAKLGIGLVQVHLEPEGANANPRPLPKNEDERQVQRFMEAQSQANPFFQMVQMNVPKPNVNMMLSPQQFEKWGRIAIGDVVTLTVEHEPNDRTTSDGT